jgi:O-antigen ligase
LTAYSIHPAFLPGLIASGCAVVLIASRPEYGIAAVLAFAPFASVGVTHLPSEFAGLTRPLVPLLPAMGIGLLLYSWLLPSEGRGRPHMAYWLAAAILLFTGLSAITSLQALDPFESLKSLPFLFAAVSLFFAVPRVCHRRSQLTVVVGGALAGLLLASAQGILQNYLGLSESFGYQSDLSELLRVQGSFVHPNKYGGYLAVCMPVAVAVALSRSFSWRMRLLAVSAGTLAIPALGFSVSRGAILGLVGGCLLWLAITRPRIAPAVAVVIVVVATFVAPATLQERFTAEATGNDIVRRADIWSAAFEIYADRPVFGVGVNNFATAYARLPSVLPSGSQRRLLNHEEIVVPFHAHNMYLNLLAEQGIVGLAAFLLMGAIAALVLYRGTRVENPAGRAIALGVGAGATTWALRSLLDDALYAEIFVVLLTLIAVVGCFEGQRGPLRSASSWRKPAPLAPFHGGRAGRPRALRPPHAARGSALGEDGPAPRLGVRE